MNKNDLKRTCQRDETETIKNNCSDLGMPKSPQKLFMTMCPLTPPKVPKNFS
jgi:hypothetical protein